MTRLPWNELVKRDRAWNRARGYYLANRGPRPPGDHEISNPRARAAIEDNDINAIDEAGWTELKSQYPEDDVE
jgi:hypothetical protein